MWSRRCGRWAAGERGEGTKKKSNTKPPFFPHNTTSSGGEREKKEKTANARWKKKNKVTGLVGEPKKKKIKVAAPGVERAARQRASVVLFRVVFTRAPRVRAPTHPTHASISSPAPHTLTRARQNHTPRALFLQMRDVPRADVAQAEAGAATAAPPAQPTRGECVAAKLGRRARWQAGLRALPTG